MLLRTHLVFSILIGVLIFDYLDSPFLFLAFLLFATIIIDIDSRKSFIGKRWYFRPLQWFFNHRGIFHTFIFGFVLSAILFFISANAGFGFFILS